MSNVDSMPAIPTSSTGHARGVVFLCAIVAALGGLLFGFDTAVISGATEALTKTFRLTESSKGLTVAIAMFNQLSGINGLLYYLNDIFTMAGFDKVSGDLQSVAIGGTNLLFTMLAMTIIDKVGRRLLLLIGSLGTAACLAGVSVIFFTNHYQHLLVWLLVGYIAFFAFSQGAVIWVYISDVFPNRVRAKGQSLGSFTHWFMCGMVSFSFPMLAKSSGGYPFVFFALMMLLQFFVVLFIYPETKGISLEEM